MKRFAISFVLLAATVSTPAHFRMPLQEQAAFPLDKCLGKGFASYEATLGKAVGITKMATTSWKDGTQTRTYKSANLLKLQIAAIEMMGTLDGKRVDWILCRFQKGSTVTSEQAIQAIGLDPAKCEVNKLADDQAVLLIGGFSVPGQKISKVVTEPYLHPGKGWAVTFYKDLGRLMKDNKGKPIHPAEPGLQIEYRHYN